MYSMPWVFVPVGVYLPASRILSISFWLIGFCLYRRTDLRERRRNCSEAADGVAARALSVSRLASTEGPTMAFDGQMDPQWPQRMQSSGLVMMTFLFRFSITTQTDAQSPQPVHFSCLILGGGGFRWPFFGC
jgi:hypothetical protein